LVSLWAPLPAIGATGCSSFAWELCPQSPVRGGDDDPVCFETIIVVGRPHACNRQIAYPSDVIWLSRLTAAQSLGQAGIVLRRHPEGLGASFQWRSSRYLGSPWFGIVPVS